MGRRGHIVFQRDGFAAIGNPAAHRQLRCSGPARSTLAFATRCGKAMADGIFADMDLFWPACDSRPEVLRETGRGGSTVAAGRLQSVCHDHCGARTYAGRPAHGRARRSGAAGAQRRLRAPRPMSCSGRSTRVIAKSSQDVHFDMAEQVALVAGDGVRPCQAPAAGAGDRRRVVRGVSGRRLGLLPARGVDGGAGAVGLLAAVGDASSTARSAWSGSRCSRWCRSSISTR